MRRLGREGDHAMDAQLDTVIQDLQGAISLAHPAVTESASWRAHPLHFAKTDVTAEPKWPHQPLITRGAEGEEIEADLDPMLQRLEP